MADTNGGISNGGFTAEMRSEVRCEEVLLSRVASVPAQLGKSGTEALRKANTEKTWPRWSAPTVTLARE